MSESQSTQPPSSRLEQLGYSQQNVADKSKVNLRTIQRAEGGFSVSNESAAREAWSTLVKAVRFFEEHREWTTAPPLAKLGVLSDFQGPNEFLGQKL